MYQTLNRELKKKTTGYTKKYELSIKNITLRSRNSMFGDKQFTPGIKFLNNKRALL